MTSTLSTIYPHMVLGKEKYGWYNKKHKDSVLGWERICVELSGAFTGMNNEELWKAVLGEIELSISKASFVTWFNATSILSCENGRVVIGVPSGFAKEWLENKYNHYILCALQRYQPDVREISCFIQTSPEHMPGQVLGGTFVQSTTPELTPVARPIDMVRVGGISPGVQGSVQTGGVSDKRFFVPNTVAAPATRSSSLNARYVFDTFIVGENNELARAACYAVSQNPGNLYNPLFIYGGVGLGKTHLLQAIGNEILRQTPEKVVKYTTSERFTNELIESIKNQTVNAFKEAYQKVDLLLIDDVQFLSGREKTQHEFFHIFNFLYQLNKQLVLTSDRPPKSIPTIEDRLRSRFEGGMIADIGRPNLETRLAILTIKMSEKTVQLDRESLRFIAENITSNIRELEGALNRVVAACEFHRIPPSLAYTKKILGPIVVETRKTVNIDTISQIVAAFYHVVAEDLQKKTRKKEIAWPRQVAMYLIRTELQLPLAAIGRYFGGRDHTTTLHACDKITKEMEKNVQTKEEINSLKEKLYQTEDVEV